MQKHYKLTMVLLVCVLGVNLKATETLDTGCTEYAVTQLSGSATYCATQPQDYFKKVYQPKGQHLPSLLRISEARQAAIRRLLERLCKNLEEVAANETPAPETEESVDRSAGACQAVKSMEVGPKVEGVQLEDSVLQTPAIVNMIRRGEKYGDYIPFDEFLKSTNGGAPWNIKQKASYGATIYLWYIKTQGNVYFGICSGESVFNEFYSCNEGDFQDKVLHAFSKFNSDLMSILGSASSIKKVVQIAAMHEFGSGLRFEKRYNKNSATAKGFGSRPSEVNQNLFYCNKTCKVIDEVIFQKNLETYLNNGGYKLRDYTYEQSFEKRIYEMLLGFDSDCDLKFLFEEPSFLRNRLFIDIDTIMNNSSITSFYAAHFLVIKDTAGRVDSKRVYEYDRRTCGLFRLPDLEVDLESSSYTGLHPVFKN